MIGTSNKGPLARGAVKQAFASDGTPFQPQEDFWTFRTMSGGVNIDFALLRVVATVDFVAAAKITMKILVETRNLQSVRAAYLQLRSLITVACQRRDDLVHEIDAEDVALWCTLGNTAYVGQLRPVINIWFTLQLPGIAAEAHDFLANVNLPAVKDKEAVRTWDPDAGAYRPAEDSALKVALDDGFNSGTVSLYDYALARTFRGLGMRPSQLAAMKVKDLRRTADRVELRIPLAKRRGMPERGGFQPWKPITQGLADILFLHIAENVFPRVSPDDDPNLAQLFPPKKKMITVSEGVGAHQNKHSLYSAHVGVFKRLDVVSPITGRQMVVNPQRERHTVLTSLAMLGCNALEIAANAGHASPETCQAYVDASIDHFQRMERLIGEAFIPIADRFLGRVVREQQDLTAQENPDAILLGKNMTGVGSCETGGCGAIAAGVAPVACYTCRKFRAWADAPHENILVALLRQQQELSEAGHAEVAETKTATIVAITDLLAAINKKGPVNG